MTLQHISQKIIQLKNSDLELREKLIQSGALFNGYNQEMNALHNKNAKILEEIIDEIGYPTIEKVGEEASEAAWLVIQHAIAFPKFMKKCLSLLETETKVNKVNPICVAYLSDRIAVFEGKPQLYGTQFDWNENGELVPNHYDDLTKVNERRKTIGLNTLEKQIQIIQNQAKNENQKPPIDFKKRKEEFDNWRKFVGWVE